jgi:hypothetical protein
MILTLLIIVFMVSLMIFFNGLYVAGEFSSVSSWRASSRRSARAKRA